MYYFNFQSGESVWDHPCDEYYRKLYDEEKQRRRLAKAEGGRKRADKQQERQSAMSGCGGAGKVSQPSALNPLKCALTHRATRPERRATCPERRATRSERRAIRDLAPLCVARPSPTALRRPRVSHPASWPRAILTCCHSPP